MNNTNKIAVLLTVFNRREKTLSCLRALIKQDLPNGYALDVYLTDDGCTDGTPEAVAAEFPDVTIIKGDGSLFWNRGMLAAWTEAEKTDHDFFLWLNDDTFLSDNCIRFLIEESKTQQDEAIIIGATVNSDRTKITYSGWRDRRLIDPRSDCREAVCFNGNIVLIPRWVYDKLGKNDPYFRHALGDFDYGLRASEIGIKNIVCSEICGVCDEHPSLPKWMDPSRPLRERWKALYSVGGNGANPVEFFYYKRKHHGLVSACLTYISNHLHVLFPKLWN